MPLGLVCPTHALDTKAVVRYAPAPPAQASPCAIQRGRRPSICRSVGAPSEFLRRLGRELTALHERF
jgi:hypothetical protein